MMYLKNDEASKAELKEIGRPDSFTSSRAAQNSRHAAAPCHLPPWLIRKRPRVPDRPGLHVDSIMESLLLQMPAGLASKLEIAAADCSELNQLVQV